MSDRRNGVYVLLIGCLLLALFTGRTFFFNLAYLLGALLIASFIWSWLSVNWVRINRQTRARRAQVGRTLDEQFTVMNSGFLPKLWIEVRDHSTLPGHSASRVTPLLMPRSRFTWNVTTICAVRGEFTLGPLTLQGGDPFGMFQSKKHIPATTSILVYPAVLSITDFAPPVGIISGGDAQRQRAPFITTNAAGLREYAPGDSLNRVHWKSSARQNRMMVKEFELDPIADAWIFLDMAAGAQFERPYSITGSEQPGFIPPSSEEYGVVIAASLAQYFLNKERTLGFISYCPHRTMLQPDRGHRQLTRILEMLATARSEHDFTFKELIALEGHHLGRGATVALISADPSPEWTEEAYLLMRRGLRVVSVLLDPLSFGGSVSADEQAKLLTSEGITTYVVRNGDNIAAALATPLYGMR